MHVCLGTLKKKKNKTMCTQMLAHTHTHTLKKKMRNKTSVTVLDFVCFKPLVIMCVCKQFHLFKKQKKTIITEYLPPQKKTNKKTTNKHTHTHSYKKKRNITLFFFSSVFVLSAFRLKYICFFRNIWFVKW